MADPILVVNHRGVFADAATAHVTDVEGRTLIGPVDIAAAIKAAVNIVGGKSGHGSVTADSNAIALALVVLANDCGLFDGGGHD